jgi:hypothetical protein
MGFQVSPGVNVTEKDLSQIVPAVSTTSAGFAAPFAWGPAKTRILIDSENTLRRIFGDPDEDNYEYWFTAANFLGYGNNLQIVRAVDSTWLNADTESSSQVQVANRREFDAGGGQAAAQFIAKYPGIRGNSIAVHVFDGEGSTNGLHGLTAGVNSNFIQLKSAGNSGSLQLHKGDILKFNDRREHTVQGVSGAADAEEFTVIFGTTGWTGDTDSADDGAGNVSYIEIFPPLNAAITDAGSSGTSLKIFNKYAKDFVNTPTTSSSVDFRGGSGDELNIAIVDEDGLFTGVKGTVLEKFEGASKSRDATDGDGNSIFWKNIVNDRSDFVYGKADFSGGITSAAGLTADYTLLGNADARTGFDDMYYKALQGGAGAASGISAAALYTDGYDQFEDPETVDVSLILGGPGNAVKDGLLVDLCDKRKDCVAFISPPVADLKNKTAEEATKAVVDYKRDTLNKDSSYAVIDGNVKVMLDRYNDVLRHVPLNGDIAGLAARTEEIADAWFSPAGFNRGQLRGVVRLGFNPSKTHRDELYKNNINPVVSFPGQGTVLFGDKTMQTKASAFDRINVRRLFIVLEKAIASASKFQLFELNDEFTRAQFRNLVVPFLRTVQGRRGITDFRVVCDETNNTGEVIDRNEFVADIFVKPARSINYIQLNFIATRSGIDFDEVGLG